MIRAVQICEGGPIAQGEYNRAEAFWRHCKYAVIRDGDKVFTGKLIPQIRTTGDDDD
jgi:hypothetical protein